jgi:hypothetical protein
MMSEGYAGARVNYCGHDGYFVADIHLVAGANVVRANGPVSPRNLIRPKRQKAEAPTHTMVDFPVAGFWRPDLGVFVVPKDQVKKI